MKKLVQTIEVEGEGLLGLIGERVLLMCANYFYTGKLVGVNTDDVCLEGPAIVYQTGAWSDEKYSDEQKMGMPVWYVRISSIESYGVSK